MLYYVLIFPNDVSYLVIKESIIWPSETVKTHHKKLEDKT